MATCKRVLVIGSTCVDVIIRVPRMPASTENLHPSSQRFQIGGCAYNVANILGRAGADTRLLTPVGLQGVFGPYLLPILRGQPWSCPVELPQAQNGCCYCLVEPSGERTFLSIHGAEYTFDPAWAALLPPQKWDYIYVCGLEVEEATGEALVSWLEKQVDAQIVYAPGPRGALVERARHQRLLATHPLLHLNAAEALALSGQQDTGAALLTLSRETCRPVVCTLGGDGALLCENAALTRIAGFPAAQVVDTIGAGDAHAGALLAALSMGIPLPEAVRRANRIGAMAVQVEGATLPPEADVELRALINPISEE